MDGWMDGWFQSYLSSDVHEFIRCENVSADHALLRFLAADADTC